MKLIYAKGACSLSVHILLEELGKKYEAIEVSLSDKTVLNQYNPKGYVPAVVLDNNEVLTEAINILQYLVEVGSPSKLLPPAGTLERARCIEWLTFVSTEIHKGMGPLFHRQGLTESFQKEVIKKVESRLDFMNKHLAKNNYLMGNTFTIADMYAIAILRIGDHVKLQYDQFPQIQRYRTLLEGLPSVARAINLENNQGSEKRSA
jgi:glutathione S-transferase